MIFVHRVGWKPLVVTRSSLTTSSATAGSLRLPAAAGRCRRTGAGFGTAPAAGREGGHCPRIRVYVASLQPGAAIAMEPARPLVRGRFLQRRGSDGFANCTSVSHVASRSQSPRGAQPVCDVESWHTCDLRITCVQHRATMASVSLVEAYLACSNKKP